MLFHTGSFDGYVNAYTLFWVNQGLNTIYKKEYPGREVHWLKLWDYLGTSIAQRRTTGVLLCEPISMVLSGELQLHVPEQIKADREWLHSCLSQI